MKHYTNLLFSILLVLAFGIPCYAMPDVVVIVNRANENKLNSSMVTSILLGSATRWQSHGGIAIAQLPDSHPATVELNSKLLKRSSTEIRNMLSNNFYTGKSAMPKEFSSDAEVKRYVATNRNAIGYISAAAADDSVKVVLTIR